MQKPSEDTGPLQEKVLAFLQSALEMHIDVSPESTAYSLPYIQQKLALVGSFTERLSDITMQLTQISIAVGQVKRAATSLHMARAAELKASPDYDNESVKTRSAWLVNQLKNETEAREKWEGLATIVSEVQEAISDRVGTLKRIDSDLRLHSKLFDTMRDVERYGGATSPRAYTGSAAPEMDID